MTCARECRVQGMGGGICVCSFHYVCPSEGVTPPSIPCLIISSGPARLCLPSSVTTAGTAAAPRCHVPTLMSPYLTGSYPRIRFRCPSHLPASPPPPCPLIYCTPSGCKAEGRSRSSRKGGGVGEWVGGGRGVCEGGSLFPFSPHCLSLFMTSPA